MNDLENGVDIVTGTPGKIEDFVNSGKLKLDQVRFLIFDEVVSLFSGLVFAVHTCFITSSRTYNNEHRTKI